MGNQKMFARELLEKRVKDLCTIKGNFTLRSGIVTDTYFDKYLFESDINLLEELCIELSGNWTFPTKHFDYIAGLEMGGVPVAVMLAKVLQLPVVFVRKEAKAYGTCKLAEGIDIASKRLLVVEDVVTTGGQVLKSCSDLEKCGATIAEVACVILRNELGKKAIEEKYKLTHLFDFSKNV